MDARLLLEITGAVLLFIGGKRLHTMYLTLTAMTEAIEFHSEKTESNEIKVGVRKRSVQYNVENFLHTFIQERFPRISPGRERD